MKIKKKKELRIIHPKSAYTCVKYNNMEIINCKKCKDRQKCLLEN